VHACSLVTLYTKKIPDLFPETAGVYILEVEIRKECLITIYNRLAEGLYYHIQNQEGRETVSNPTGGLQFYSGRWMAILRAVSEEEDRETFSKLSGHVYRMEPRAYIASPTQFPSKIFHWANWSAHNRAYCTGMCVHSSNKDSIGLHSQGQVRGMARRRAVPTHWDLQKATSEYLL